MTLLSFGGPTSGSHHSYLQAYSGQWAAPFTMLSEADRERLRLWRGQESSTPLI